MKLGFMTFVLPGYELDRMVAFAKEAGYDGIEIRVDAGHAHGVSSESSPDERKRVRALFAEARLEIPSLATSVKLASPDPARRGRFMDMARANLDLAADLGAGLMRVFCGTEVPQLDSAAAERVAAAFDELGRYAEGTGVLPMLECGHDLIQGGAEAHEVIRRVTTPNFAALWNHSTIDEPTLDVLKGRLRHVHVHKEVLDPENTNIRELAGSLEGIGYDGYISLEIIEKRNLEEDLLRATAARLKGFIEQAGSSVG